MKILLDSILPAPQDARMIANSSNGSAVDVKEKIRAFVLEYAAGHGVSEVRDDEPLLKNNIIDSLGVFRLIDFLEENFPLTVEDTDMVPEGFDNLNAIAAFVKEKTRKAEEEAAARTPAAQLAAVG